MGPIHVILLTKKGYIIQTRVGGGGGGGGGGGLKRRGLGPRNNVLTTCKAVTQRGIIRYNKYVQVNNNNHV